jgi:hypothetical protein
VVNCIADWCLFWDMPALWVTQPRDRAGSPGSGSQGNSICVFASQANGKSHTLQPSIFWPTQALD